MAIIITGMHRSGTSMITRLLNLCGMNLGAEERLLGPLADNLAGFWENRDVVAVNDAVLTAMEGSWDKIPALPDGWEGTEAVEPLRTAAAQLVKQFAVNPRWGWKDPRFSLTLPFWMPLLDDPKMIICLRPPEDVAASLNRRNGLPLEAGFKLWHDYNRSLLASTQPQQRIVTAYDLFFTDPGKELRRLIRWLGWEVSDADIDLACRSIQADLRHHSREALSSSDRSLPDDVAQLHDDLTRLAALEEGESGEAAKPLVSIIMLTYNALEFTQQAIDSITANTHHRYEMVLVDNGSTDGTKDYLRGQLERHSDWQLIDNADNRGFAAGNNQGVEAARGRYVLLLNNDVLVADGWLTSLVNSLERDPRIGMVGPVANNVSGRQRIDSGTYSDDDGYYEFAAYVRERNKGLLTPRRRIAGFAMLLQRELYRDLGGLDEQFGSGNYEDDDLCVRLREQGLAIMVNEGIYLHHFGSKTFEHNKIDYTASLSRNSVLFREKWPHIDMDWLLEMDEPLLETLERESLDALTHIKSGDSDKGLQMCEAILAQNPLQVDALHALGMAAHLAGDSQAARELYEHVIQINEKWHGARESLAQLELEEKNILSAQVQLAAILKIDETHQSARRLLAQCFLAEEKFQEAVSLLMGLIGDFPKDWQSHLILATLYAEIEQVDQAKGHLESVLASNPEHTEAQEWLARLEDIT